MSDDFDPYLQWLGIAPHERPLDYYQLLGLERFEPATERIAAAADQRMAYIHSFQTGPRGAHTQRLLNELAAARVCLLNPGTKSSYDDFLRGFVAAQPSLMPQPPSAWPQPSYPGMPAVPHAIPIAQPIVAVAGYQPPLARLVTPVPIPAPTPTAAAPPVASAAPNAPSEVPLVARPWFPVIVIVAVVAVALTVWGIGSRWHRTPLAGQTESDSDPDADRAAINHSKTDRPPEDYPSEVILGQEGTGEINFPATVARLHGPNLTLDTQSAEPSITGWTTDEDSVSWEFRVIKPDIFRVEVTYAAKEESQGGQFVIGIGEAKKQAEVVSTGSLSKFRTDVVFLPVESKGKHTLYVHTVKRSGEELWSLQSVRFAPRGLSAGK